MSKRDATISVYDGPLSISVTLLGSVVNGEAWLRSDAQEGDVILVTGAIGGVAGLGTALAL